MYGLYSIVAISGDRSDVVFYRSGCFFSPAIRFPKKNSGGFGSWQLGRGGLGARGLGGARGVGRGMFGGWAGGGSQGKPAWRIIPVCFSG